MANTALSKGTTLQIKVGSTYKKIAGLKNFSGLGGGSASVMETTDLDSVAKEKRMGLPDEGQVKFDFNYVAADVGQQAMEAARATSATSTFVLTIPETGNVFTFDGFVLTFEKEGGVDKVVPLSVNVEVTGAIVKTAITGTSSS